MPRTRPHASSWGLFLLSLTCSGCFFSDNQLLETLQEDQGMSPDMSLDMSGDMPVTQKPQDMSVDFAVMCGNGIRESGELCDSKDCPDATSCAQIDTKNNCTQSVLKGSAEQCNAQCIVSETTACVPDDGCCPAGCTAPTDTDCDTVLLNDACGQPVLSNQVKGVSYALSAIQTSESCCRDFNADGVTDNNLPEFTFNGASTYNTYMTRAYDNDALHFILELEGAKGRPNSLDTVASVALRAAQPSCFKSATGPTQPKVYTEDALFPAQAFDTLKVEKGSLIVATAAQALHPIIGIRDDALYAPLHDAQVRIPMLDDLTINGPVRLSGYVKAYEYFSAVNDYFRKECTCFGQDMFSLEPSTRTSSCNDIEKTASCQADSECEFNLSLCPAITSRFSSAADLYVANPELACGKDGSVPCDAVSVGIEMTMTGGVYFKSP